MPKIKFTQRALEKLPYSEKGQVDYFDTETKGFGFRVGKKSKTFFAQKKIDGKDARKSVGDLSLFTLEQARDIALDYLQEMRKGVNPTEREKKEKAREAADRALGVSVEEVLTDMFEVRKGKLKELTTVRWYKTVCNAYLDDWLLLPVRNITRDMVVDRFRKISGNSTRKEGGAPVSANAAFRVFRAVWNYGKARYKYEGENPVKVLSDLRLWHREQKRTRHIPTDSLKAHYDAVMLTDNPVMRDYLLLLLFTGMRRTEACSLRWSSVDFKAKALTVKDTKNNKPLRIPVNTFLFDLFTRIKTEYQQNEFVFPGVGRTGHMVEPKKAIEAVVRRTGVEFTSHDLRRTLLGVATELGIDPYIRKVLVNHTIANRTGDITEDYVEITLKRMEKPSQYLCDELMRLCGISDSVARVG